MEGGEDMFKKKNQELDSNIKLGSKLRNVTSWANLSVLSPVSSVPAWREKLMSFTIQENHWIFMGSRRGE